MLSEVLLRADKGLRSPGRFRLAEPAGVALRFSPTGTEAGTEDLRVGVRSSLPRSKFENQFRCLFVSSLMLGLCDFSGGVMVLLLCSEVRCWNEIRRFLTRPLSRPFLTRPLSLWRPLHVPFSPPLFRWIDEFWELDLDPANGLVDLLLPLMQPSE